MNRQRGFNYPVLLFAMVVIGVLLAAIGEVWRTKTIREQEQQLLFVGNEFRQAIARYYESTPGGAKQYPASLDDLLLDKRFPHTMRHLRRIYADPIIGTTEWGLIVEQGRIVGVHSLSDKIALRRGVGDAAGGDSSFAKSVPYSAWNFIYRPNIR